MIVLTTINCNFLENKPLCLDKENNVAETDHRNDVHLFSNSFDQLSIKDRLYKHRNDSSNAYHKDLRKTNSYGQNADCEKSENNHKRYASSSIRKESVRKPQEQPASKISHSFRTNTKRPIDLVYTGHFCDVMQVLPVMTDMRFEENKIGEERLKVRVWITNEDLYTNKFYSKIHAHLLYKKIKTGKNLLKIFLKSIITRSFNLSVLNFKSIFNFVLIKVYTIASLECNIYIVFKVVKAVGNYSW